MNKKINNVNNKSKKSIKNNTNNTNKTKVKFNKNFLIILAVVIFVVLVFGILYGKEIAFIMFRYVPSMPTLLRVFIMNGC